MSGESIQEARGPRFEFAFKSQDRNFSNAKGCFIAPVAVKFRWNWAG